VLCWHLFRLYLDSSSGFVIIWACISLPGNFMAASWSINYHKQPTEPQTLSWLLHTSNFKRLSERATHGFKTRTLVQQEQGHVSQVRSSKRTKTVLHVQLPHALLKTGDQHSHLLIENWKSWRKRTSYNILKVHSRTFWRKSSVKDELRNRRKRGRKEPDSKSYREMRIPWSIQIIF